MFLFFLPQQKEVSRSSPQAVEQRLFCKTFFHRGFYPFGISDSAANSFQFPKSWTHRALTIMYVLKSKSSDPPPTTDPLPAMTPLHSAFQGCFTISSNNTHHPCFQCLPTLPTRPPFIWHLGVSFSLLQAQ